MSAFVDSTLLSFSRDAFVSDVLTNGLGLQTIFAASFSAIDIEPQGVQLDSVGARSFKVPAYETVRSNGTEERILPDAQRVRTERVLPRFGRLDWVDVAFDAVLAVQVQQLNGNLQSVASRSLVDKLGGIASIADLQTKLAAIYPQVMVDDIFKTLRITTLADFMRKQHLFVDIAASAPPPFDPQDPAATRPFTVPMRVKIADGFDVAAALQSAKLCSSILQSTAIPDDIDGVDKKSAYAFVTVFDSTAVDAAPIPGFTTDQAKDAVRALFASELMFAHFI
jgi:hypothetical protein